MTPMDFSQFLFKIANNSCLVNAVGISQSVAGGFSRIAKSASDPRMAVAALGYWPGTGAAAEAG
jgi:hypothetical protein